MLLRNTIFNRSHRFFALFERPERRFQGLTQGKTLREPLKTAFRRRFQGLTQGKILCEPLKTAFRRRFQGLTQGKTLCEPSENGVPVVRTGRRALGND